MKNKCINHDQKSAIIKLLGTLCCSVLVALAALGTSAMAVAPDSDTDELVQPIDRQTAEIVDAKIIAQKTGWSLRDTLEHMKVQNIFGALLAELAVAYPDTYAGGELAERPGATSRIRFKDTVPADVFARVAAVGIPVKLVGGSKYSAIDLQQRSIAVLKYLVAAEFKDVGTAVMAEGYIEVTIGGNPRNKPSLPPELRDDVRISIIAGTVTRNEHTRGGARVFDLSDGSGCTSGFAVISILPGGETGVSTAGHCDGIDRYTQPTDGLTYTLTHEIQHLGLFGDVEWKSSPHSEPAEYYATATELREVNSVESWASIATNSWYCVYGRSSNDRECDEVYSTFVNSSDGLIFSLVGMTNDNTIPGDSGGPWSIGTEATGIHRGDQWIDSSYRNVFSVVDRLPSALWVRVSTQ